MTAPGNIERYYDPWKDYNETLLGLQSYARPIARSVTPLTRPVGITVKALGNVVNLAGDIASYTLPAYLAYASIEESRRKAERLAHIEEARRRKLPRQITHKGEQGTQEEPEVDISDQIWPRTEGEDLEGHTPAYKSYVEMLKAQGRATVRPKEGEEQVPKPDVDTKREHRSREGQRAARAFERVRPPANLKEIPYINPRIGAIKDMDAAAATVAQSVNKYGIAKAIASLRESDDFKPGGRFYDLTHMLEDPKEMKTRLKRMAVYKPPDYKTAVNPVNTYIQDHRDIARMYIPKEFYQFLPDQVTSILRDAPRAPKTSINDTRAREMIDAYRKKVKVGHRKV